MADANFAALVVRIVRKWCPELLYGSVYRYRVQSSSSGGKLDLQPSRTSKLGILPQVLQWTPGIEITTPVTGSEVAVAFLDADPAYPVVLGFTPLQSPNGIPTTLKMDCSGTMNLGPSASRVVTGAPTTPKRFLREGDQYTATGSVPGTVIFTFDATGQPSGPTTAEG